jgi:hypothetical protein
MESKRNVLTWLQALRAGWEPGDYHYTFDKVPVGRYLVNLDFKIWAKKVMAVNCYCTLVNSGVKICLTVYCREQSGQYRLAGGTVDFTTCPTQSCYDIEIIADQKKKIQLIRATLMA